MTEPHLPSFWNIHQTNPRRTLTLAAIGALLGLGIAGYGLFTANGTTTAVYPAEDAAIVNGVPILRIDLDGQVRALYNLSPDQASKAQKAKALSDMIREELYVQRGVELGMPTDDTDVRSALVGAAEAQTVSQELTNVPSAAALAAYYAAHHDHYASEGTLTFTDWLVPANKAADAPGIAAKLRSGAAAQSLGLINSGASDGTEQFYFAARIHLGEALFGAATRMADGSVSMPIIANGQVHILSVARNLHPVVAVYAEVKARVLQDYTEALKKRVLDESTKFLTGRAKISFAPDMQ